MTHIEFDIADREVEEKLQKLAILNNTDINHLAMEAIQEFLNHHPIDQPSFKYKKLDPVKLMTKIQLDVDDSVEGSPFSDIEDSNDFARKLRKDGWER